MFNSITRKRIFFIIITAIFSCGFLGIETRREKSEREQSERQSKQLLAEFNDICQRVAKHLDTFGYEQYCFEATQLIRLKSKVQFFHEDKDVREATRELTLLYNRLIDKDSKSHPLNSFLGVEFGSSASDYTFLVEQGPIQVYTFTPLKGFLDFDIYTVACDKTNKKIFSIIAQKICVTDKGIPVPYDAHTIKALCNDTVAAIEKKYNCKMSTFSSTGTVPDRVITFPNKRRISLSAEKQGLHTILTLTAVDLTARDSIMSQNSKSNIDEAVDAL